MARVPLADDIDRSWESLASSSLSQLRLILVGFFVFLGFSFFRALAIPPTKNAVGVAPQIAAWHEYSAASGKLTSAFTCSAGTLRIYRNVFYTLMSRVFERFLDSTPQHFLPCHSIRYATSEKEKERNI